MLRGLRSIHYAMVGNVQMFILKNVGATETHRIHYLHMTSLADLQIVFPYYASVRFSCTPYNKK